MRVLFEVSFYKFLTPPVADLNPVVRFLSECQAVSVENEDNNIKCIPTENGRRLKIDVVPDDCLEGENFQQKFNEMKNTYSATSSKLYEAEKTIARLNNDIAELTMKAKMAA